jgi:molecular chaperone Hsp33
VAEPDGPRGGELRRFILEAHPVRGFWVRLGSAWEELRRHQHYPPAVEALLGEAATATVLLAATLKFQGTLTLQLTGNGRVRLLVAQCTHDFKLRAVARLNEHAEGAGEGADFRALVGDGRLTVTIEADERSARYQGIVALEGASFAECLENYFATSEQLPTRLRATVDAHSAAGLLIQKLPTGAGEAGGAVSQSAWEDAQAGLAAIDAAELRTSTPEALLQRLCGAHDCRLFAATPVQFFCRCSPVRVADLLRSLGAEEVRAILAEQGAVGVTCEFCGRPYRFDAVDIERLFASGAQPPAPQSIN